VGLAVVRLTPQQNTDRVVREGGEKGKGKERRRARGGERG
jgi:hypothetical protein